jgi:endonuclease/exonuclease/phosphatase family metal-dependent hydrolase
MIKVASYNMRKGIGLDRRRDPGRVLSVLRELDADIVALQEADRRFGTRASAIPPHMFEEHSDYVPVDLLGGRPYAIGWHGNALLVRKGAEVEESHALHLPTLEPRRRQQARAILHHLAAGEDLPTILMGDCNEWRNQGGCLHDFGERHRLVDTGHSFHSRRPVAKLDRIFASPDLQAVDAGVHRSALAARASDHLPIWARFERAG